MNSKIRNSLFVLGVTASIIVTAFILANIMVNTNAIAGHNFQPYSDETVKELRLFEQIFNEIRGDWVEEIDDKTLIRSAIQGMIDQLDEHSSLIDEEQIRMFRETTTGEFFGVGMEVTFDQETEYLKVISPYDTAPAGRAGLKPGDLVIEVDGVDIKGMPSFKSVELIKGEKGTTVTLKVLRGEKELEFQIVREKIESIVARGILLDGNIAYVKLTSFNEHSAEQIYQTLKTLHEDLPSGQNFSGVVLDLRFNPGGLLDQAIDISDYFLKEGIIVYTKGRNDEISSSNVAHQPQLVNSDLPMVVLINEGSASASEIVTGALKDNDRAIIVGTKSYGKGSVQTIRPVQNEVMLRLTTHYYYTASGTKIHGNGITPDVVLALPEYYEKDSWMVIDPQMLLAVEIIRNGYNEDGQCPWQVVEDGSEDDGYGIKRVCSIK